MKDSPTVEAEVITKFICRGIRLTPEQQFIYGKKLQCKILVNPNTNCWQFTGYRDSLGYGKTSFKDTKRRSVLAHRLSFAATFGDIPDNILACHRCDNPSCINPLHIFLGTNQQNTMDSVRKNRHKNPVNVSEKVWCAKFTNEQVLIIREMCVKKQFSQNQIAKMFNVTQPTISGIHTRSSWKNL